MTERHVLGTMKNDFIVKMHYAFQNKNKLFFVIDYCPGGELFFYLSNLGRFKEDTTRFYASNILLAIEHLHFQKVLYRDLKPENVLMGKDGYVKITDFGLSKEGVSDNSSAKSFCGTPEYLAPETLNKAGHGRAADWWSFGAIIYEMLTGLPPFYHKDRQKLYHNIKNEDPKLSFSYLSDSAKDLLTKLLCKDPDKRLGGDTNDALEVKEHPWFDNVNWELISKKRIKPPYVPVLKDEADVKHFDKGFTSMDPQEVYYDGKPANQVSSLASHGSYVGSADWEGFTFEEKTGLEEAMEDN